MLFATNTNVFYTIDYYYTKNSATCPLIIDVRQDFLLSILSFLFNVYFTPLSGKAIFAGRHTGIPGKTADSSKTTNCLPTAVPVRCIVIPYLHRVKRQHHHFNDTSDILQGPDG